MRYLVRQRSRETVVTDDMGGALAVVRERIEGMAPHQAAMAEIQLAKEDARGRVRRVVSGRALVGLARGVPEAELFGYGDWLPLDEAARVGRSLELDLVPDGTPHERGRWSLVVRYEQVDGTGAVLRDRAVLWVADSLAEAVEKRHEAETHLSGLRPAGR